MNELIRECEAKRCSWDGVGPKDGEMRCPICFSGTDIVRRPLTDTQKNMLGILPADPFADAVPYGVDGIPNEVRDDF